MLVEQVGNHGNSLGHELDALAHEWIDGLQTGAHRLDAGFVCRIPRFDEVRCEHVNESCRTHLLDVLAVDPLELVVIERTRILADALEREELGHLLAREQRGLAIRRPSEQCKVVEQGIGQVTHIAIFLDACRTMALGELLSIRTADHRQMSEGRRGIAEGLVDEDLTRRVGKMVITADDVRHLHVHVIADDREVVSGRAVAAHEDHVVHEGGVELRIAVDDVVHDDGAAILGDLEAPHMGLARIDALLGLLAAQSAARIGLVGSAGLHGLTTSRELLGSAKAGVDVTALLELLESLPVGVEALGLHIGAVVAADMRTFVPVKTKPLHGADDEVDVLLRGALGVSILDTQDEGTVHRTRERPVIDGGTRATDVQLARRRRGKANSNLTHIVSNLSKPENVTKLLRRLLSHSVSYAKEGITRCAIPSRLTCS